MKLETYLKMSEITDADFAEKLGVNVISVRRYLAGQRIPNREVMEAIARNTGGEVRANDFYNMWGQAT